ncbi:MAG: hypothetical protein FRX48_04914 [Lasallia pustulata]|uniref:Uncharacterized protein n=1 Tax=Lasallia pustulata TaxID=136370 RepID=A0A5M8PSG5_9LECA|nr:MAG: hypothetical protein FRX48_04914 [Lasallia pustulata]
MDGLSNQRPYVGQHRDSLIAFQSARGPATACFSSPATMASVECAPFPITSPSPVQPHTKPADWVDMQSSPDKLGRPVRHRSPNRPSAEEDHSRQTKAPEALEDDVSLGQ